MLGIFILLTLLWITPAQAQLWSSILDPSRATDWTVTGVTGGVPNWTVQCGPTIAAYGTSVARQSPSTITAAMTGCPANSFVLLGPGTFWLNSGFVIPQSHISLRGSGPNSTTLDIGTAAGCSYGGLVCVVDFAVNGAACGLPQDAGTNVPAQANWTAGYAAGTTQITLDSTAGNAHAGPLVAGMDIILDQLNDPDSTATAYAPFTTENAPWATGAGNMSRTGRLLAEMHHVTSVIGTGPFTVTITPPIAYQRFAGAQTPQAWWCNGAGYPAPPTLVGIENLAINNSVGSGYGNVSFIAATQSWVKNIRSLNGVNAHIFAHVSANIEIRDSYFYHAPPYAGGTLYGMDMAHCSFCKIENNIFHQLLTAIMSQPCFVCVYGYNFSVGDGALTDTTLFTAAYLQHVGASHHVLLEGNDLNAMRIDHASAHGDSPSLVTIFRNRMYGTQPGTIGVEVVQQEGWQRFNNFVGNVFGTVGTHVNYEYSQGPNGNTTNPYNTYVYCIGWYQNCQTVNLSLYDTITQTSMLRWGNYDTATGAVRYCGTSANTGWVLRCNSLTEIPVGNAVPAAESVPTSFYLSTTPSWFGSQPWPTIGPGVTGQGAPAGLVGTIPAKNCYLTVLGGPADGSGPALPFDANTCYVGGGGSGGGSPCGSGGVGGCGMEVKYIHKERSLAYE